MPASLPGIRYDQRRREYQYYEGDVPRIPVPVNYNDMKGNATFTKDELNKWFDLESRTKTLLPQYIIQNGFKYGDAKPTGKDTYWYLNGRFTVYEPVEWIPCVRVLKSFPASYLDREVKITETEVSQEEFWTGAKASLSISAKASYMGIQAAAETEISGGFKIKKDRTRISEYKESGKLPAGTKCSEVMVGLMLKMREVKTFNLRVDDVYWTTTQDKKLNWGHGESWSWDDVLVPDSALQRDEVKALQFYFQDTYAQALPVLHDKHLQGMHILFSCKGWTNWFAYTRTEVEGPDPEDVVVQAYEGFTPLSTIMITE